KSSSPAPGTFIACQVAPPSTVRNTVPARPLAQATFASTAEMPRRRTSTPETWGTTVACAHALPASNDKARAMDNRVIEVLRSRLAPLLRGGGELGLLAHHQHRDLQRLLVVQARVDGGAVGAGQVGVGQVARAARAFGDVLAGEFQVHAAQARARSGVDLERLLQLAADVAEAPGLVAVAGRLGVAM